MSSPRPHTQRAPICDPEWELKLADGNTATWHAPTAEEAAQRYVDAHRGATVVATRYYLRHGFFPHVDIRRIMEVGQ
jgi:hypothetical protein